MVISNYDCLDTPVGNSVLGKNISNFKIKSISNNVQVRDKLIQRSKFGSYERPYTTANINVGKDMKSMMAKYSEAAQNHWSVESDSRIGVRPITSEVKAKMSKKPTLLDMALVVIANCLFLEENSEFKTSI